MYMSYMEGEREGEGREGGREGGKERKTPVMRHRKFLCSLEGNIVM